MVYGQVSLPKMRTVADSLMGLIIGVAGCTMGAMRNFGGIMLLLGILGFFYASQQVEEGAPIREGATLGEEIESALKRSLVPPPRAVPTPRARPKTQALGKTSPGLRRP